MKWRSDRALQWLFESRASPKLYAPDIKFNREIGRWKGQKFHAQTGEQLDDRSYEEHMKEMMPSAEDKKLLLELSRTKRNGSPRKPERGIRWQASAKSEVGDKFVSETQRRRKSMATGFGGIQSSSADGPMLIRRRHVLFCAMLR